MFMKLEWHNSEPKLSRADSDRLYKKKRSKFREKDSEDVQLCWG